MSQTEQMTDWGKGAEDYDRIVAFSEKFSHDCIGHLKIPSDLSKDVDVLDVACGTGSFALMVANQCNNNGGKIIATDVSPGMIEVLKSKCKTKLPEAKQGLMDCRVMDAQTITLPDGSISFIGCVFGLMFFPDKVKCLKEMHRVLKPGASAAIAVWKYSNMVLAVEQLLLEEEKVTKDELPLPSTKTVLHYENEGTLRQDLLSAGFCDADIIITQSTHQHEFPVEELVKATLANPFIAKFGLTEQMLHRYYTKLAIPNNPDSLVREGTAYIAVVTKAA